MKNSRRKGKSFELLAAKAFSEWTGIRWRRTAQHSSAGVVGDIEVDVKPGEETDETDLWSRLHVEVKSVEAMRIDTKSLRDAVRQAARDCPQGSWWVVLYRERRGVWVLVVPETVTNRIGNEWTILAHYAGGGIAVKLESIAAEIRRRTQSES